MYIVHTKVQSTKVFRSIAMIVSYLRMLMYVYYVVLSKVLSYFLSVPSDEDK